MSRIIGKNVSEWLNAGWEAVLDRPFFLIAGVLVLSSLSAVGPALYSTGKPWYTAIGLFLFYILYPLAQVGYTFFTLKVVRGEDAQVSDMLAGFRHFFPVLGTSLLYSVIVAIGFLLFIIPGIIWATKYAFAALAVLDQSLGPMDALAKSGEITAGYKGRIFGAFLAVFILILILSLPRLLFESSWVALVITLFITIPGVAFQIGVHAAIYHSLTAEMDG
jgi:uncharacterized membrane protein